MKQTWNQTLYCATADGTPVANTTTESIIFPDFNVPANFLSDGAKLRLRAFGKLSTTATPTITFAIRWGGVSGTVLAITEAITTGSGVSNVNWDIEAYLQVRANGATGSVLVWGVARVHTAAGTVVTNVFGLSGYDAPAAVTVDLTAAANLSLTADWSAASASNTLTGMDYTIESLN